MGVPVIGIAGYQDRARWDIWDTEATIIQQTFVRALARTGGCTVVLPPGGIAVEIVERLDGLLLPGGADIGSSLHGRPAHPMAEPPHLDRDKAESMLLRAALDADLPVFGVCRGLQLLALTYGGTLHQHLPDVVGHNRHGAEDDSIAHHEIITVPGSIIAKTHGARAMVNSHHHQAVDDTGGLVATAWSADQVVEAAEDPSRNFVVGVQWHPELSGDPELFAAFVEAAAVHVERFRATSHETDPKSEVV